MTSTIFGRWQTRLLLMGTAGLIITIFFALLFRSAAPFVLLFYVTFFGLIWDMLYNMLQKMRWDRDWPPLFSVVTGIVEAIFLVILLNIIRLPGVGPRVTILQFSLHYTAVWLLTFLIALGPLKTAFPHLRFKGGQWLGKL